MEESHGPSALLAVAFESQPGVVEERITNLTHEFLLAIGSVILVTILLLPFRVALIAALAIPVTLCATLGVMNALGIALHQVSIAALIVVLGIVVDDAIVIADNYVELLDRKVPKSEAAWRCASEVVVPVLTATITIIATRGQYLRIPVLGFGASESKSIAVTTCQGQNTLKAFIPYENLPLSVNIDTGNTLHVPQKA